MKKVFLVLCLSLLFSGNSMAAVSSFEDQVFEVLEKNPVRFYELLKNLQNQITKEKFKEQWKEELKNKEYSEEIKTNQVKNSFMEKYPYLGNPEAPNTVICYFSFTCGYCSQIMPLAENLLKKDVKIIFKGSSLSDTNMLAFGIFYKLFENDKDKAFLFVNEMFKRQKQLIQNPELTVSEILNDLKIDLDTTSFVLSTEFLEVYSAGKNEQESFGMKGSPTFLINNKLTIRGLAPYEIFEEALNMKTK